jgi:hypothetical protein
MEVMFSAYNSDLVLPVRRYRKQHTTTVKILLCRVLVGKACDYGYGRAKTLTMPPAGFDSVTGLSDDNGGTRMWVVHNNRQVYPAYCVTVRLMTKCVAGTSRCDCNV